MSSLISTHSLCADLHSVLAAPVVTKVEHGAGPFCKSNFTVSFFVPFADQVRLGCCARCSPLPACAMWLHGQCKSAGRHIRRAMLHMQDNTPKPTKDVYLHSTPAATFFVSQFGGFVVDDITVSAKAAALVAKLKARGESFEESVFFSGAGFLQPSQPQKYHAHVRPGLDDAALRCALRGVPGCYSPLLTWLLSYSCCSWLRPPLPPDKQAFRDLDLEERQPSQRVGA